MELMKRFKAYLRESGVLFPVHEVRQRLSDLEWIEKVSVASKTGQILLANQWKALVRHAEPLPSFEDVVSRLLSER